MDEKQALFYIDLKNNGAETSQFGNVAPLRSFMRPSMRCEGWELNLRTFKKWSN